MARTFANFVDWLIFGEMHAIAVLQEDQGDCNNPDCSLHNEVTTQLTRLLIFGDSIQCHDLVNRAMLQLHSTPYEEEDLDLIREIYDHTTSNHPLRDFIAAHVAYSIDLGWIGMGELHNTEGRIRRDFLMRVCEQEHKFRCIKQRRMNVSDVDEYQVSY